MKKTVVFFGSFQHYSAQILEKLQGSSLVEVIAVVTTPPQPAGRNHKLQQTPVHTYAHAHHLPVLTPKTLTPNSLKTLTPPDLFVVAGYGKLLPPSWLDFPKLAPVNVHFSLLPKYRGAMPGEWAILMGETQTGVSLIEMSPQFDSGAIYAQASTPIATQETRETLYTKLYDLGAQLFIYTLPHYLAWKKDRSKLKIENFSLFLPPQPQPPTTPLYARLLTKQDSFIPWALINQAMSDPSQITDSDLSPLLKSVSSHLKKSSIPSLPSHLTFPVIERAIRALAGWPGVWTTIPTIKGDKRLKLLSAHLDNDHLILDQVQLAGSEPSIFNQIKNQVLS